MPPLVNFRHFASSNKPPKTDDEEQVKLSKKTVSQKLKQQKETENEASAPVVKKKRRTKDEMDAERAAKLIEKKIKGLSKGKGKKTAPDAVPS